MPDIKFDYKSFLKTVPNRPGSYRMYSDDETVIGVWSLLIFISGLFGIRSFKRKKEI